MVAYPQHSSSSRTRSSRHSRSKPSLFEKLCFGHSSCGSDDSYEDKRRRSSRALADQALEHGGDRNTIHAAYHSDRQSMHALGTHAVAPNQYAGVPTSEAHPSWSRLHPSMQTYYETVSIPPPTIGLLQSPSLNSWQRQPTASSILRAPSLPQLPVLTSMHCQSAPSQPASRSGTPGGSMSIPLPAPIVPPPPMAGSWPAQAMPVASVGLDTNRDGRPNVIVSGPDMNHDGIPDVLEAGPRTDFAALEVSLEQRKQLFEQSLRQQLDMDNRRIQELTIAQKEVVRQRALEQKANIDRQAAAAMCNLDRRGAEQVVGLQRAAYGQRSQLEMQAAHVHAQAAQQPFGRSGMDMRMHSTPRTMHQFQQLPPPPMVLPTQVMPVARVGLDTNHDGRPNVFVTGPDLNHDGIPDVLEAANRNAHAPPSPYWQEIANAGGYQSHPHMQDNFTPRSSVLVEFPSPPHGSPVNTSVLGSSVQVAEEEDAIDEYGQIRRVFQISGMNGEPLAIVQMLQ